MAYAIRKASAPSAPKPEQALGAVWRMYNLLVAALDGHVHGGVTAGAGNTSGWQLPATALKLSHHSGRYAGVTVPATGSAGAATFTSTSRDTSVVAELVQAINQLQETLHNHVHGGVTAGAAATAAWAAPGTIRKIADLSGLDPDGVVVTPSANGAAVLRLRIAGRGPLSERGAIVKAWNGLVQAIDGHIHGGVTAAAANTAAFALSAGTGAKVADLYGRDVDGAIVS